MKYDVHQIREKSHRRAKLNGYEISEKIPFIEDNLNILSQDSIVNRALCLNIVVASSFSSQIKSSAMDMINKENLKEYLSTNEKSFLIDNSDFVTQIQAQQEAIYPLGWILGKCSEIKLDSFVPMDLARKFPDLFKSESSNNFKSEISLRGELEIFEELDLYYCLHWAVKNAGLSGQRIPGKLPVVVIRERRRALEWVTSQDEWDQINLDT